MKFNAPLNLPYCADLVSVYKNEGHAKGHNELDRTALYIDLPCFSDLENNRFREIIMGNASLGRYTLLIPLANENYEDIALEVGMVLFLTRDGETKAQKMKLVEATKYAGSHWDCIAEAV